MWKEHPDYQGYLEVSTSGEVRSLCRISPKGRRLKGKMIKPSKSRDGHLRMGITIGKGTIHRYVHVLVLETFIGPRPSPESDARHLNGIPDDNRLENLSWGSKRENRLDDLRNGVNAQHARTHCPLGHEHVWWNNSKSSYKLGNGSGVRGCRSCCNARSYARRKNVPFSKEIADFYYHKNKMESERGNEGNQLE